MRREVFPPHWPQEAIERLEANVLWQEYVVTHPMKSGGRDLDDIRAFVLTICPDLGSDKTITIV